jgi:hypothetical protein
LEGVIVGPNLFYDTVSADSFPEMEDVLPEIENHPRYCGVNFTWQQEGAVHHGACSVRNILNTNSSEWRDRHEVID